MCITVICNLYLKSHTLYLCSDPPAVPNITCNYDSHNVYTINLSTPAVSSSVKYYNLTLIYIDIRVMDICGRNTPTTVNLNTSCSNGGELK